jgi:glycosyltransferase involved in cell wall biosynthesis
MHIYLVSIGEPLPSDAGTQKLLRTGTLFHYLLSQGHRVTWWTSSFNHTLKKQRCDKDEIDHVGEKGRIVKLYAPGYKKSVSMLRFVNHSLLGYKFNHYMKYEVKPDVIVTSYPAIELAFSAIYIAKKHNIPCLVDARDMWPDTIFTHFKNPLVRTTVKIALYHMTLMAKYVFTHADSLIGITDEFVKWGGSYAKNRNTINDKSFPLTSKIKVGNIDKIDAARAQWGRLLPACDNTFLVCFFGVISDRKFDFRSVFKASKKLNESGYNVKFVLCGLGDDFKRYEAQNNDKAIVFPGWVDAPEILTLMEMADIGLAPYRSSDDFKISVPIKFYEYMSEGLAIVSCLDGVSCELIESNKIGLKYNEGDAHSLFNCLVRMIEDRQFRRYCSDRAKKLYTERFDEEYIFLKMMSHIEKVRLKFTLN